MNRDEWPDLSNIDLPRSERPRFPDGDPIGPLLHPGTPKTIVAAMIIAGAFLAALALYACDQMLTPEPAVDDIAVRW